MLRLEVKNDPFAFSRDDFHRSLNHGAGVEQLEAENVAGHVLGVDSHQGFFLGRNITLDQR